MKKVSVIIPAYNCSEYISEALDSVFMQTYPDIEIIVVNDGSNDETIDILEAYDDRIKVYSQSNSGVSTARNVGAELAKGEYLAFLDSDDIWQPDKIEKQISKIEDGYNMSYTNRYNIGDIGDLPTVQTAFCDMPQGMIFKELIMGNMITTSSVIIKRSKFNKLCGFESNLDYCEDWDLWLRCAERFAIGVNLEPLVKYRLHKIGLSSSYLQMAKAREYVVKNALNSPYCNSFTKKFRSNALSKCYATSAWESAVFKDYKNSLNFYRRALILAPLNKSLWYNLLRLVSGRI